MRYDKMWLIPELYLKELSEKEGFPLVKAKYGLLAKKSMETRRVDRPAELEKAPPRRRQTRAGSPKQPVPREGLESGYLL
jgi:hypothetical protein